MDEQTNSRIQRIQTALVQVENYRAYNDLWLKHHRRIEELERLPCA